MFTGGRAMKTTVIDNLTGFGNLLGLSGLANRKKIRSFFAYLKSCCNFAMYSQSTISETKKVAAFFIAIFTGYRLSNGCCTSQSVIVLCGMESDSFFNF
jgi:hypothetical protein